MHCNVDENEVAESVEEEEEDMSADMEKQISVDPMSLKHAPQGLPRPKYVSCSHPCSAASSPPPQFTSSIPQHSVAPSQFVQQRHGRLGLPRSKSCGQGIRSSQPSSSDEFDALSRRPVVITMKQQTRSVSPKEVEDHEEFKCGALCFFLPALSSKKKQEQQQQEVEARRDEKVEGNGISDGGGGDDDEGRRSIASLEKFECASSASSSVPDGIEDELEGGIDAYFDLPLELMMRGGGDDAHSPVKAAFVFDGERKGVLKKSAASMSAEEVQ